MKSPILFLFFLIFFFSVFTPPTRSFHALMFYCFLEMEDTNISREALLLCLVEISFFLHYSLSQSCHVPFFSFLSFFLLLLFVFGWKSSFLDPFFSFIFTFNRFPFWVLTRKTAAVAPIFSCCKKKNKECKKG